MTIASLDQRIWKFGKRNMQENITTTNGQVKKKELRKKLSMKNRERISCKKCKWMPEEQISKQNHKRWEFERINIKPKTQKGKAAVSVDKHRLIRNICPCTFDICMYVDFIAMRTKFDILLRLVNLTRPPEPPHIYQTQGSEQDPDITEGVQTSEEQL